MLNSPSHSIGLWPSTCQRLGGHGLLGSVRLILAVFIGTGLALTAPAAIVIWEGDTSSTFSTGSNWTGGNAPANDLITDIASFQTGTIINNPNLTASRSINGLEFVSGTAAWTFTGSGGTRILTIGSGGITSNDDSTQTFNNGSLGIALGANAAFTSDSTGALSFGSTLASFALNTFTLTLGGSSTNAANAIAEPISGTGGITKTGTGTWLLSGANTFTGKTVINDGVLAITAETGLGANPGSSVTDQLTLDGGTLRTQTAAVTINDANREIFIGSSGGTFDTVTNLTIANTNVMSGSGTVTKTGAGTLSLSAVNTHTGDFVVDAGILLTSGGSSIGNSALVTVNTGATWQIASSETVGNISGAGNITFTGNRTLTFGDASDRTFSGVISDGANTGVLTKQGTGTVVLSGANTYDGATNINAGALNIRHNTGLGATSGDTVVASGAALELEGGVSIAAGESLTLSGTGVSSNGALRNISGSNSFAGNITLNANTEIQSDAGTLTLSGTINGSAASRTLTFDGAGDITASNVIGANVSTVSKTGTGTLTLSGANTYTGATNIGTAGGVDAGTVVLGANNVLPGTTVNIYGGTLDLNTRTDTIGALNLGGGAAGSTATITGTTGTLTLGGNITYSATNNPNGAGILANLSLGGADRTFTVGDSSAAATDLTIGDGDFSDTITLGTRTLIITGAGNTLINSIVGASGDTGGFTKDGTGTVTFYGDRNYYTGTTTVNDGSLILDTLNSLTDETIRGNLVIGDGIGAADSAVVIYGTGNADNKIANTSAVTINSDGVLNLNNSDDTIGSFTLSGGHITTGTGVLTLNGNITTTANAAARTAVIDGVLDLGLSTRTFTVANDTPASDLTVNAAINFGSFIKAGAGTMTITSDNTFGYGGTTTVNAGVLNIQHANALGQTGVSDPTKGTTVASGAALQIQGGISVGAEALTLNGTGVSSDGALRSLSGANSWAGTITLGSASRINTDAGKLTLNGSIVAINQNLTVGGAGDTTINGAIGTGSGTLTKDGGGTLELSGNNTYTGATAVTSGTVSILSNDALGSTLGATTISSGATLAVSNNITSSEQITLSGSGVSGAGAIQNLSGANTLAGNLALAASSTIGAASGSTLTAAGAVSGTGFALTKVGSGTLELAGTAANTYTGGTNVNDGTILLNKTAGLNALGTGAVTIGDSLGAADSAIVQLLQNNQIADLAAVTVSSDGRFDLNNKTETVGSIAGNGEIIIGTGQLIVGGNDASTTWSGELSGGASSLFQKEGTGTLTIASTINLAGTVNLNAGTIELLADNLFTGTVNVLAGTTLRLSNVDVDITNLNFTGTGVVTLDFTGAASTLNVTNLTLSAGVTVNITNWANATDYFYAQNFSGATLDLRGGPFANQIVFNAPTWSGSDTIWQSGDRQITPVPEPSAYGAMFLGVTSALLGYRRWKKSKRPAKC
jgi:fibronectin-binding autotransporter adhesin